jgi:hypothetical protein
MYQCLEMSFLLLIISQAFPIYYEMIRAVISFEEKNKESCVIHLENITFRLRHLLRVFYENLKESRISHSVWLSYVQGFQGWGVGRMIDGEFIKYDGLSGNHVLFFQALDAFLGMDRYLTDENMIRYIPANQRKLCIALKKHSFRNKLKEHGDMKIEAEIKTIVNHLRVYPFFHKLKTASNTRQVFRAAHRTRVMPYLEQPAPERLTMTAGKSVLEGPTTKDTKEALKVLDQMLVTRLKETV